MPQKKTRAFPKKVFIYVCHHNKKGNPCYAVATEVDEIPGDSDGEQIGSYSLESTGTLVVHNVMVGPRQGRLERHITNMK